MADSQVLTRRLLHSIVDADDRCLMALRRRWERLKGVPCIEYKARSMRTLGGALFGPLRRQIAGW